MYGHVRIFAGKMRSKFADKCCRPVWRQSNGNFANKFVLHGNKLVQQPVLTVYNISCCFQKHLSGGRQLQRWFAFKQLYLISIFEMLDMKTYSLLRSIKRFSGLCKAH